MSREAYRAKAVNVISKHFCEVFIMGEKSAAGFSGKRGKPDFYFSYQSVARMNDYIDSYTARLENAAADKAARREQAKVSKASDFFKVDDILVSSWGYEQTNIDFYQVLEVKGKSVLIREVCKERHEDDMTGTCSPLVGEFPDSKAPMLKRVDQFGYVTIASFAHAKLADRTEVLPGVYVYRPQHFTSYA